MPQHIWQQRQLKPRSSKKRGNLDKICGVGTDRSDCRTHCAHSGGILIGGQASATAGTHVLIIVQNLPVPLDRRVWLECQALVANGYEVSVICPKGPGDPSRQLIDGVHIYKYRPAPEAKGLAGFALEFGYSWLRTAWLSLAVWHRRQFSIMQACNPPDTYWCSPVSGGLGGEVCLRPA